MDGSEWAALITAIFGAVGIIGALWQNRRGKREQTRQEDAADAALSDKTSLDETKLALSATRQRAEDAERGETRWRDRADELEAELDALRDRHRAEADAQDDRCRTEWTRLREEWDLMRTLVVNEMDRAAAGERVAILRPHPHTPTTPPSTEGA